MRFMCIFIAAVLPAVSTFFQGVNPLRLGARRCTVNFPTKLSLQPSNFKNQIAKHQRIFLQDSLSGSVAEEDLNDDFFEAIEPNLPEKNLAFRPMRPPHGVQFVVTVFHSGDKYEGEWDGRRQGFGKQTLASGETLQGEFVDGRIFNGNGTLLIPKTGFTYKGTWVKGQMEGPGWHISKDGHIYEGSFRNGRKHGHGRQVYPNYGTYEGEWRNNVKHGQGKFTSVDGHVMEGEWVEDEMVNARGVRKWRDGTIFTGEMRGGYWQGPGTLTNANNLVYTGVYVDGLLNGPGTVRYPDGQLYRANFREGRLTKQLEPIEG